MIGALAVSALTAATPLLLASSGETLRQRAGVLNIGIEGEILAGAFAAFAIARASGSAALGCLAGAAAGLLLAGLFATIALAAGADQIVTGTAVNLLSLGATGSLLRLLPPGAVSAGALLPAIMGRFTALDLAAWGLPAGVWLLLFRTSTGIRLRAAGESARNASSLGIGVGTIRTLATLSAGMAAGLAGAALTLELADTFIEGASAGRGFLALALVAFGSWRPGRVALACGIFGLLQALQFALQARGFFSLPPQALLVAPYVFALVALAGLGGKSRAPADLARARPPANS
jgi:ABC-type uncharacterized transport system permease subunit